MPASRKKAARKPIRRKPAKRAAQAETRDFPTLGLFALATIGYALLITAQDPSRVYSSKQSASYRGTIVRPRSSGPKRCPHFL